MSDGAQTPTGVIHDIGYRHYEGPVLGRPHLLRALYLDTLRGCLGLGRPVGAKIMAVLLGGAMVLPALVIGVTVNVTGASRLPLQYTGYATALQLVISIYVAVQAPVAVSRDLRFRTITLYFSRPLRRGDYVLARYAALTTAVFGLIAAPLAVLYGSALLAKLPWWEQTERFLLGLIGAALFAVVLSGLALLIAAVTPRRGFGVAAIITTLLLLSVIASTGQAVARQLGHLTAASYFGMIDPFSLVDGVQVWLLRAEPTRQVGSLGTLGEALFGVVTAAVVAVSTGLLLLRYRKVSPA